MIHSYVSLVKIKHVENTYAIEVYGFVPEAWGKGYAIEVRRAAMEQPSNKFCWMHYHRLYPP